MDTNFTMKGDYTQDIRDDAESRVYALRDFLLTGKRVNCKISHLKLDIGGSSLSRRIKDCKDLLKMNVKAIWKPYKTTRGTKTHIREYYMDPEDIEYYLLNSMGLKILYKSPSPGAKSIAISSYDAN